MNPLTPEQLAAGRQLKTICDQLKADLVLIGAMAYRTWIQDPNRHTVDIDVAVAVDLDEYHRLVERLQVAGWKQEGRTEHRWTTTEGVRFDLIPAGPRLRQKQVLDWPISGMRMSLVGFEHVFKDAVPFSMASDFSIKVIPVPVLALLKIIAYLDNPHQREKDLQDFAAILRRYEVEGDRRFSDTVFDARLDYDSAGAYLLGKDLAPLCSEEERRQVLRFIQQLQDIESRPFALFRRAVGLSLDESDPSPARALVGAFTAGIKGG